MMAKIKEILREQWFLLIVALLGGIAGWCVAQYLLVFKTVWLVAAFGWLVAAAVGIALVRQVSITGYKVLCGKKEVVDSYNDLLEQTKKSVEYFSGYDEEMKDSVAIYSHMATSGVEAPIANSIISFAQELGPDHTVILVDIDHSNAQWSVRVAGRSIHLSQLRAVWTLVNRHLEESAAPIGTLIVKKDPSIMN